MDKRVKDEKSQESMISSACEQKKYTADLEQTVQLDNRKSYWYSLRNENTAGTFNSAKRKQFSSGHSQGSSICTSHKTSGYTSDFNASVQDISCSHGWVNQSECTYNRLPHEHYRKRLEKLPSLGNLPKIAFSTEDAYGKICTIFWKSGLTFHPYRNGERLVDFGSLFPSEKEIRLILFDAYRDVGLRKLLKEICTVAVLCGPVHLLKALVELKLIGKYDYDVLRVEGHVFSSQYIFDNVQCKAYGKFSRR